LDGIAVLLKAYTWIIVIKRKKSENKLQGMNGMNVILQFFTKNKYNSH
jgi:hypothetical protein